jgi:hypothetical protein
LEDRVEEWTNELIRRRKLSIDHSRSCSPSAAGLRSSYNYQGARDPRVNHFTYSEILFAHLPIWQSHACPPRQDQVQYCAQNFVLSFPQRGLRM